MKTPAALLLVLAVAVSGFTDPAWAQRPVQVDVASVDAVFEAFDGTRTPGCAVGVSEAGVPVLLRAYGMADLEHGIPNTAETIFEPGSVAKQFTAAATVLLVLEGKISLDDDIRMYIPELADYGEVVTIGHLLHHTSGLRDWGSVAGIEGWPRTRRAHTNMHALDIASRQRSLNYKPGDYYSYTNTGFNLQAILVERVSGMSLAEFSRRRIFEPLGMDHTQWRDDFTRIVKDRAVAYRATQDGGWSTLMPFEDVYGNGGLLTTVEDLLRFTRNLETGELGGPRFIEEMHRQSVLNSGQVHFYASGLQVRTYKGVPVVEHSGSTAGYRGHLTRFPDQGIAVAVMCNTTTGNAGGLLRQVADLYLGDAVGADAPPSPAGALELPAQRLEALAGLYKDTRTGGLVRVRAGSGALLAEGATLIPVSQTRFEAPGGGTSLEFEADPFADGRPAAILSSMDSPNVRIEPVPGFAPTEAQLGEYTGTYRSDEAEATYTVAVENGAFVLKDRWGRGELLQPLYPDAFGSGGTTYIFRRDPSGRVVEMSWSEDRVWDLRFRKAG